MNRIYETKQASCLPGLWADGSCFSKVIQHFRKKSPGDAAQYGLNTPLTTSPP